MYHVHTSTSTCVRVYPHKHMHVGVGVGVGVGVMNRVEHEGAQKSHILVKKANIIIYTAAEQVTSSLDL